MTLTGLTPGEVFDAEIVTAEFDTVTGRFDDSGALIDFDDDQGVGLLSRLMGDVPPNGQVHLAISRFEDTDLDGEIEVEPSGLGGPNEFGGYSFGSYDLVVQVPEPARAWLLASALAAVVGLARRRGRGDILPGPKRQESP